MAAPNKPETSSAMPVDGAAQPAKSHEMKPAAPTETAKPAPSAKPAAKSGNRTRDLRQSRMTQAFSQIVAVLMRDANFRNLRIGDLEWLVIPPIMSGQFRLAHAQTDGAKEGSPYVPVAVALWARVSPQVDKSLSENLDKQVWLRPNQWTSGDILWLMAVAGDRRAVPQFVKQLQETEFKGKQVKLRTRGADGKMQIKVLSATSEQAAN